MANESLWLPRRLALRILHQAQDSPEREICGLVGADGVEPAAVYPVANIAADPSTVFEMDAKGLVAAMKAMREKGERLWAVYHSHPRSPGVPSARDLAETGYPGALHLIVSLDTKGVLQLRAWEYRDGAASERKLIVKD